MDETALPVPTPDGRLLMVSATGPHDGHPVLSFHGSPGGRLFTVPDHGVLDHVGVRLVTYDRPGYGASTRQRGRTVADAAHDAAVVADAMGWQRFGVLGFSGGGPHALAAAAQLGGRVTRCAVASSCAPPDAAGLDWSAGMSEGNLEEFATAREGADALEAALAPVGTAVTDDVYAFMAAFRADLPAVDQAALDRPDIDQLLATSIVDGLALGVAGWVDDDEAFVHPWGFDVASVRLPVGVWHGDQDTLVPVAHAAWLNRTVPEAEGHIIVGSGHLGVLGYVEEILRWLTA